MHPFQYTLIHSDRKLIKLIFPLFLKAKSGLSSSHVFLYLFDHTIAPILNYASEIKGLEEWSKLETLYLKACKYALGGRSSKTADAVYAELGRVSLQYQRRKYCTFFRIVIILRFRALR